MDSVIVGARLLQFGSALVLFGSPLFLLYGYPPGNIAVAVSAWSRRLAIAASAGALIGVMVWISALAAVFFPDDGLFGPKSLWIISAETQFGQVAFARGALSAAALVCAFALPPGRKAWTIQALFGVAVVASFAWTGHGVRDTGWSGLLHTGADVLHLLAAGVWIGALASLSILILQSLKTHTTAEARIVLGGLDRFSGIGPAVVAVLVLTGLVNSWFLVGLAQWQALFTTAYGIALTAKLGLFAGMLLLAAANRYRLSPKLRADVERGASPATSLRKLRVSILTETTLSILILAAVALLGTWEPPVSAIN